jgi:hypothetical protein
MFLADGCHFSVDARLFPTSGFVLFLAGWVSFFPSPMRSQELAQFCCQSMSCTSAALDSRLFHCSTPRGPSAPLAGFSAPLQRAVGPTSTWAANS